MLNGPAGLTVNAAFELVIDVMFRTAFPALIRIRGTVAGLPSSTEPKLTELGATLSFGPLPPVPVPDSATVGVCCGALLGKLKNPDCGPAAVGRKTTVILPEAPGPMLAGPVWMVENIGLELLNEEIVKVPFPVLVMVTVCVVKLPTATDPKFSDVGVTWIPGVPV